jgi:hypothetical protein
LHINEFRKLAKVNPALLFENTEGLTPEYVTDETVEEALDWLEYIRKYLCCLFEQRKEQKRCAYNISAKY